MSQSPKMTPMLEQYFELKRQAPDAILFFRLGDFYEMFFEDAEKAAPILDLVLTARGKGGDWEAPMCGVPYHAADQYIARLVRRGLSVAVGEQVEDPSKAKGIVRREIVRVVTPGTAIDGSVLDRDNCYLLAVAGGADGRYGAAWLDVSTGELFVSSHGSPDDSRLEDDVARYRPREVILEASSNQPRSAFERTGAAIVSGDENLFDSAACESLLNRHFGTHSLKGFGLEAGDPRIVAAGAALRYASSRHKNDLSHVKKLRLESESDHLVLDSSTLANLEIFDSRERESDATLWRIVDATKTAMGSRLLRRWIARPLATRDAIFERHDAVDELTRNPAILDRLGRELSSIADIERLVARVSIGSASPRECLALAASLEAAGRVRSLLGDVGGPLLVDLREKCDPLESIVAKIRSTIADEPSQSIREGGVIRDGVDAELDDLRAVARDSKSILLRIEREEREKTGVGSLKVRYNNVFGYYIEVSRANVSRVPEHYIRKQTLANAERFITPELKELEEKILGAEERSKGIETRIYESFLGDLAGDSEAILVTAEAIAGIDGGAALASVAVRRRWTRPELSEETEIAIEEGRHPVVEAISTERFIPNDTAILREENGIQIITGPNMGGKSTYLRQVAHIVLLCQAGSFVPAKRARLGIFDRIFTRVGASDNLARGESTFMVEMQETANILNNATPRSLVILDEVGRGTATFDGLSLAWAIIEYLHDHGSPITLFATHYHEVTDLGETKERVANYSLSVKEWKDQIIFLRKVVPGAADKSYGIQVARLAGVPPAVTERAKEVLAALEEKEHEVVDATRESHVDNGRPTPQLALFSAVEDPILKELRRLDVDAMSPIEALNKLHDLWRRAKGEDEK